MDQVLANLNCDFRQMSSSSDLESSNFDFMYNETMKASLFFALILASIFCQSQEQLIQKGLTGSFYFDKELPLVCDRITPQLAYWISDPERVILEFGIYDCAVSRATRKGDRKDCKSVANTHLAAGSTEKRKFKIVDLNKDTFGLDFSADENRLHLACKAIDSSFDLRNMKIQQFQSVLDGIKVKVININSQPEVEKVHFYEAHPKKNELIAI